MSSSVSGGAWASGSGSWDGSFKLLRIALAAPKSTMKARIFISAPQKGHKSGSTS